MYIYRETENGKAPTSVLLFYCLTVFPELFNEGHSSLDCDVTMQTLKYECALKNLSCHIINSSNAAWCINIW